MTTVILKPIDDGHVNHKYLVRCSECGQELDRVPDERTAFFRAEEYAAHEHSEASRSERFTQ